MAEDLLHFLKTRPLFSSVSEAEIKQLIPKFIRIELTAGSFLFHQGDPSEGVYILVKGKLSTLLKSANNQIKTLGHLEAGETVGELSVLANEVRPFSVKVLQNSVLYKLSRADFIQLCQTHPAVIFATIHPIISRAQNIIQLFSKIKNNNVIILIPANSKTSLDKFAKTFARACARLKSIIFISDFMAEWNNDKWSVLALQERVEQIKQNSTATQKIIYLIKSPESPLGKVVFKQADNIYLIADAKLPPKIDSSILAVIHKKKSPTKTPSPSLILLHSEQMVTPMNTAAWLDHYSFNMYHHIKIDTLRHYKRLLRFIRDKAVGVVLSGGGTRGWAHLGALKALRQQKTPIDFIGGASVGAIIAGFYAINESYAEAFTKFQQLVTASANSTQLQSLTWPILSIFNGKDYTNAEMQVFQQMKIEDLWLPYFCISSNLANYNEEIHRSGLLWEKTRASTAIPGLIPPMIIKGDIHLDGGLLNNLPVDVMRQFIGNKAKIIAVNLISAMQDTTKYHFPPILTFKEALLTKLHLRPKRYVFPRFIDTFLRGLLMGSYAKSKQNGALATILINVSLQKYMLLHSDNKQTQKMVDIGYRETMLQLKQFHTRD